MKCTDSPKTVELTAHNTAVVFVGDLPNFLPLPLWKEFWIGQAPENWGGGTQNSSGARPIRMGPVPPPVLVLSSAELDFLPARVSPTPCRGLISKNSSKDYGGDCLRCFAFLFFIGSLTTKKINLSSPYHQPISLFLTRFSLLVYRIVSKTFQISEFELTFERQARLKLTSDSQGIVVCKPFTVCSIALFWFCGSLLSRLCVIFTALGELDQVLLFIKSPK